MKNKRTFKQEMEKKRQSLFLVGLLVSLSLALMAFEWANFDVEYKDVAEVIVEDDFILEIPLEVEIEKPKPKTIVPAVEFDPEESEPPKVVDNKTKIVDVKDPIIDTSLDIPIITVDEPEKEPKYIDDNGIKDMTELSKDPLFPGGEQAMYEYLSKHIRFTECARQSNVTGKVYVQFVIEKDGSVGNVKVMRGLGCGLDEMASKAVKKMPKWTAGEKAGKKVRVRYNLPVRFQLK